MRTKKDNLVCKSWDYFQKFLFLSFCCLDSIILTYSAQGYDTQRMHFFPWNNNVTRHSFCNWLLLETNKTIFRKSAISQHLPIFQRVGGSTSRDNAWLLGKAKLTIILRTASRHTSQLPVLNFKTTCFHYLPRVGPKQLCALAHLGSTHEAGTF